MHNLHGLFIRIDRREKNGTPDDAERRMMAAIFRLAIYCVIYFIALGAFVNSASAEPRAYPLALAVHMSNPAAPSPKEVTHDFIGAGGGVRFDNGFTIEAAIGAQTIGCTARDCGRSLGAHVSVTWRGKGAR